MSVNPARRLNLFGLGMLLACAAGAGESGLYSPLPDPTDPLDQTATYSLRLGPDGPLPGYYAVGMLGGNKQFLTNCAFNFSEKGITHYDVLKGKELPAPAFNEPGTAVHLCSWAAHTLCNNWFEPAPGRQINAFGKDYGVLPYAVGADGQPVKGVRPASLFHPQVIEYLTDYDAAVAKAWGAASPRGRPILGWGLDNEWEPDQLDYGELARKAFVEWLAQAYENDVQKLNTAWETKYSGFAEAQPATKEEYATRPAAWLDWHAFQTERFTAVMGARAKALHENDPLHRGVQHKSTQCTAEMPAVIKGHALDHGQLAETLRPFSGGLYGVDVYGADDTISYNASYFANCIQPLERKPDFGAYFCETNNHSGPAWQWAETYWRVLGNGLKQVDFFCTGSLGAEGDFSTFSFVAPDGKLRQRAFYAARWASMVHRTEALWREGQPAAELPLLALVMSSRDALLADNPASRWGLPENNRLRVYTWLREQGYWVDVIPPQKLRAEYLRRYAAVLLVGVEHLEAAEAAGVKEYVRAGGVLVADTRAGVYDEHHRPVHALDEVLGLELGKLSGNGADLWFQTDQGVLRGDYQVAVKPQTAQSLQRTTRDQPGVFHNQFGQGQALYFATKLGMIRNETPGTRLCSRWLRAWLEPAGVNPGYRAAGSEEQQAALRVEAPQVDAAGNCVVPIGHVGREPLTAVTLDLQLPAGDWRRALWAPAEHAGFVPVELTAVEGGRYRFSLPEMTTAGMLYLLDRHEPVLGIPAIAGEGRAEDGYAGLVLPGRAFTVRVQLANSQAAAAGQLRLMAKRGWRVEPATVETPALPAGGLTEYTFTVTPPAAAKLYRDWLYPLVARWASAGQDLAVCSATVQVAADYSAHPRLLTDNGHYPDTFPYRVKTGATYEYVDLAPGIKLADPADNKFAGRTGQALIGGANLRWNERKKNVEFKGGKKLSILLDLKTSQALKLVRLVRAADLEAPLACTVSYGAEPTKLTAGQPVKLTADSWASEKPTQTTIVCTGAKGRYVRLDLEYENGGGLDEVEIWSEPSP